MTVSFYGEIGETTGFQIVCMCNSSTEYAPILDTYNDALAALEPVGPRSNNEIPLKGCENPDYCLADGARIKTLTENEMPRELEVTLSNFNARRIVGILGFEYSDHHDGDVSVTTSADDMIARIEIALAIEPEDEGVPPIQEGSMVSCGREPGYTQNVLSYIRDIAIWCKQNNRNVVIA